MAYLVVGLLKDALNSLLAKFTSRLFNFLTFDLTDGRRKDGRTIGRRVVWRSVGRRAGAQTIWQAGAQAGSQNHYFFVDGGRGRERTNVRKHSSTLENVPIYVFRCLS